MVTGPFINAAAVLIGGIACGRAEPPAAGTYPDIDAFRIRAGLTRYRGVADYKMCQHAGDGVVGAAGGGYR